MTRCEQNQVTCLMYRKGGCVGLNHTDFDYHCPFYKDRLKMELDEVQEFERGCQVGFEPKVPEYETLSAFKVNGKRSEHFGKRG